MSRNCKWDRYWGRARQLYAFPIMHLICPPKFCISIVFRSVGTAVIPRRNEKHRLCKIWGGGQIGSFMGNVEVAYWSLFSNCPK